jgi:ferritin
MLSSTVEKKLNEHMNAEFFSAHLYLSMAAYFKSIDLLGFAHWMEVQFEEEMTHARRFFEFIDRMDGRAIITDIAAPPFEWDSPLAAFEYTYTHEQQVSARIHELVSQAITEKDHATNNFLQWFVNEQVEEESSVKAIVQKLRFVAEDKMGILMIDQEIGRRPVVDDGGSSAQ